jgi:ribosomal protein S17E
VKKRLLSCEERNDGESTKTERDVKSEKIKNKIGPYITTLPWTILFP